MYSSLKSINWSKLRYNNEYWQYVADFDVLVKGDEHQPSQEHLTMAQQAIGDIEAISGKAIQFLMTFLKLEGDWELLALDFGCCFSKAKHDFELTYTFEDPSNPHEYMYAYFVVSFDIQVFGENRTFKPQRIEIGFR